MPAGQSPEAEGIQTMTLVSGSGRAVVGDLELVGYGRAAERGLGAAACAVTRAAGVFGLGESVGDPELKAVLEAALHLEQDGVVPCEADRGVDAQRSEIGIRTREVDVHRLPGRGADDAGREGDGEGGSIRKLIGAAERRSGKIAVDDDRDAVAVGVYVARVQGEAADDFALDAEVELLDAWILEAGVEAVGGHRSSCRRRQRRENVGVNRRKRIGTLQRNGDGRALWIGEAGLGQSVKDDAVGNASVHDPVTAAEHSLTVAEDVPG